MSPAREKEKFQSWSTKKISRGNKSGEVIDGEGEVAQKTQRNRRKESKSSSPKKSRRRSPLQSETSECAHVIEKDGGGQSNSSKKTRHE